MIPPDPAPPGFVWPDGSRLALSLVVNVEEGAERSIADGDDGPDPVDELGVAVRKPIRAHGNESNYQYGIRRGAPRVLAALEEAGVPATWAVCGRALEKAPWLAEAIMARGDEPCSHGYRWAFTAFMSEAEEREFITRSTASIAASCGRRPLGWLSRYLHSDATRRLLLEQGYAYHMDDYSDDFPFWDRVGERAIVVLPYALDSNDMKFWLSPAVTPEIWLDYARRSFEALLRESETSGARMMSLGLHLRIIGRPGRIDALRAFLEHVRARKVWIARREEIAAHFAAEVPEPQE